MFYQCDRLTSIDITDWDTSNVVEMTNMIPSNFHYIYGGLLDINNVENPNWIVYASISSLKYVKFKDLGKKENTFLTNTFYYLKYWGEDKNNETTNRQSLVDSLLTNSFDRISAGYNSLTINIPSTVLNRLTDEEKAQITAKGFTLAAVS